jgi:hypothetical protein
MTIRRIVLSFTCLVTIGFASDALATPGATLLKYLSKQLSREGGEEAATKISQEVGETMVERVAVKVTSEGGEQSLESVSVLVAKHGPDIMRALDNSPSVTPLIKALDELPADQIPKAAARLAAGPQGKELAETTIRYGSKTLSAEVAHPGVGGYFVKALGTDGASLCEKLTTDQAIALGRHVDDIAALPPSQRSELLKLAATQTDRFVQFIGRFVEQNPGKVLFTAAGTGVVLSEAERILGGDEIVLGPDGVPMVITKPGVVGRAGQAVTETVIAPVGEGISWLSRGLAAVVVLAVGAFASIKLWSLWRRETT